MNQLILIIAMMAQVLPSVTDNSLDRTHKKQHERTPFYKTVGGKQVPCGVLAEFRGGTWRPFLAGGDKFNVPTFDTRADAEKWLKISCPIEGKAGHD